MKRDNIIVLTKDSLVETWGSLTELCEHHPRFSYSYLKSRKFPFTYKGYQFSKVPFRKKVINI